MSRSQAVGVPPRARGATAAFCQGKGRTVSDLSSLLLWALLVGVVWRMGLGLVAGAVFIASTIATTTTTPSSARVHAGFAEFFGIVTGPGGSSMGRLGLGRRRVARH